MKLDVLKPWYAEGLHFTCSQCGNCCTGGPGYVWISGEEVSRLAKHLKISRDEALHQYCRRVQGKISLKEHRNSRGEYDCTFLREIAATREVEGQIVRYTKRVCTIYPVRPLQCRTWPFWDGNLATRRAWQNAAKRCPGMNAANATRWSLDEIEKLRTAWDWPDRAPGSE